MLWIVNFNAFIGRFADTALGAYRVWKGALKNKRLHKNKWFLNIIQTGINPTTPDLTGSIGFVTKNHKYFSPITSRICKCFIWQSPVFLRHPVGFIFPLKVSHEKNWGRREHDPKLLSKSVTPRRVETCKLQQSEPALVIQDLNKSTTKWFFYHKSSGVGL